MKNNERGFVQVLVIALAVVVIGGLGTAVASQGALPGDALYGVNRSIENLQMRIAFGDVNKFEHQVSLNEKRHEELTKLVNENAEIDRVETAVVNYEESVNEAFVRAETARNNGASVDDVLERMAENQLRQAAELQEVHDRAPDEAKGAIERAQSASVRGFEQAAEALGEDRAEEILNRVQGQRSDATGERDVPATQPGDTRQTD